MATSTSSWLSKALIALAVSGGVLLGVGGFTFRYAAGASYLRTAPEACVNCHIMQPQYDGWLKGPHHDVAVCVDCHLPQAFVPKYLTKAENGWRHGKLFTTQTFVEPIQIAPAGREVLQANCVRCHEALVSHLGPDDGLPCVHCHADVAHGERAALGGPLRVNHTAPKKTP
ncbi:MAG: cytochrome c nitrite reductase small subunit [Myxococcus sp.]|nr:cytochrome c nitrite reductase small subunit [Myxococcus sp.]